MIQKLRFKFMDPILVLIHTSDLRAKEIGLWLLRSLVDADENFREKCMEAGLFDVRASFTPFLTMPLQNAAIYKMILLLE